MASLALDFATNHCAYLVAIIFDPALPMFLLFGFNWVRQVLFLGSIRGGHRQKSIVA